MKRLALCLSVLALTGCVSPPQSHEVQSERVVELGKDAVWTNLMEWFTSNQIQIKTVEKDSGIIYAERSFVSNPTSAYSMADCGMQDERPIAPTLVGLNVFVRETGRQSTKVTVNTNFSSIFRSTWDGTMVNVDCNSRGGLETDVLNAADGRQVK